MLLQLEGIIEYYSIQMQRRIRLKSLVQAPKLKDYEGEVFEINGFSIARQIESEYSFEGNWWYIWFKGDVPLEEGDPISLDSNYIVDAVHVYKNYKRGSVLLL